MRRLLIAAAFVSGVVGGCYLQPNPAPGFRYSCESDSDCLARDCNGGLIPMAAAVGLIEGCDGDEVKDDPTRGVGYRQVCIAGLCEFPCDLFTFQDDCPPSSGYNFCFNGKCANVCGTDSLEKYKYDSNDDFCTAPQRCVPFGEDGIDPALLGSGGGMNSVNPDTLPEGAGFCGTRCDAQGAPDCPPGQYCTGALCIPGCDNPDATPCAEGTTCFAYGGYAACLTACDQAAEQPCPDGLVCVPGVNICQPSCLGEDGVDCEEGFDCDADLGVCIPTDIGGSSESTG